MKGYFWMINSNNQKKKKFNNPTVIYRKNIQE